MTEFSVHQPSRSQEKRPNQKGRYKKKQPIDSIDTVYAFYEKQRQESRDSHFND
jgi:hypothetical protein